MSGLTEQTVCICGHLSGEHSAYGPCAHNGNCDCERFKEPTMTEQLPRTIAAKDIRVGDRVRRDVEALGVMVSKTITVVIVDQNTLYADGGGSLLTADPATWWLLARPEPPREVGSRWVDPANGARYVLDDNGDYRRYRAGAHVQGLTALLAGIGKCDERIARLTALDGV